MPKPYGVVINGKTIGRCALFSYRAPYDLNEFSLTFQTAVEKNEAKLSSFVQFGNERGSYCSL